jgi:GNAT superfamily N-acetyltransferase
MTDAELKRQVRTSMVGFWGLMAAGAPGGSLLERPGLVAAVVPSVPDRSVFNAVIYWDPEALESNLEELARAYAQAGVQAWTVWVPEDDAGSAALLEAAGHKLDAEPRAMGMALEGVEEPDLSGIDLHREIDLVTLSRINDRAYGYEVGSFERALGGLELDRIHRYAARVDDEDVATMLTADFDGDTEICFVATLEAARGKGLAAALMRQSLWDARERGCETTTLQATKLGAPVYERLGYRDLGALQMWERRQPGA